VRSAVKSSPRIVFVSSEVVPFVKTGGLADVAGSLPPAMARFGHEVTVILPAYRSVDRKRHPLSPRGAALDIPIGKGVKRGNILTSDAIPDVSVRLIDQPEFFGREGLYDAGGKEYADNAVRFGFFSRAVLELIKQAGTPPDVIHCNDWQTGLIPVYLRTLYRQDPFFRKTRTVFTVHNVAYQGCFPPEVLRDVHLPDRLFVTEGGLEYYGRVSYLKGGILFSDLITTVSPTYSREIQTEEYGYGLEGVLKSRSADLRGVLNGIDVQEWDPAVDPHLPGPIRSGSEGGKERAKRALLEACGLEYRDGAPALGVVSRLAIQKGFDLLEGAAPRMLEEEIRLIVLGQGEKRYADFFRRLMRKYPDKVYFKQAFDNRLAHMIYGGCDLFLMPSRYEPCGLGQMIAMRYGTVPLARRTGGLADTIRDEDGKRTGYLFRGYHQDELLEAFYRVLKAYSHREEWREIMRRGMSGDYSWEVSGLRYIGLYLRLLKGEFPHRSP